MSAVEEFKNDAAMHMEGLTIDAAVYYSHECAREKGWHDPGKERTVGDYLMLMVSELAEALEEFRAGHEPNEIYYRYPDGSVSVNPTSGATGEVVVGKPEGLGVELADCLIRIFDFCGLMGIDLEEAVLSKMQYNFTREYRHGGKTI